MTVTIANTNLVDSFNTWRLNTNLAATTISNNVVTVTKTGAARGGTTQGSGHIKGTFTANELRSRNIRGGNTSNESTITLHSNTTIEARSFTINANTEFTGNVNFTTSADDRIIMGDLSRIRVTGGNSGDFLRKTNLSEITATPLTMRQLGDLSSNSAHIILSSSNTAFSEELNTPDLRFSAGPSGQDKFRVYGDGDSTAGNSDLLIQLVSADADSNLKIQTSANNTVHTFSADGNFQSTGRLTTVGITTSGTILPSGGSVNIGSGSAKFEDGNFSGVVTTDKLSLSTTAGDGVSSDLLPTVHNAKDLGSTNYQWRNIFSSGTATLNNVTIGGTLGTTGDLTAVNLTTTGDTTLGNADSDTITATGQFASALIPSTDDARDLGSSTKEWKDLYIDGVANIDELSVATGASQGVSTSLIPKTDGTHNLGSTNREWQNLFIDGTAHIDTLDVDENATFGGTITATSGTVTITTGAISVANITTLNTTGLASLDGGIDVDGAFTVADTTGNMVTTGTATVGGLASFNGGIAVDTNKFTVADTSGNVATAGTLTVAGETILNGAVTINGTIQGTSTFTNVDLDGNTNIGDNASDTLTITSSVDSNIIPTGTRNLGSDSSRWTNGYINNLVGRNITLGADGDSSGTNSLTVFGDVTIDGSLNLDTGQTVSASAGSFTNITASSDLTINGNSTLGNAGTDTVTINGVVATDIIPSGNKTKDLGSSSARWRVGYFDSLNILEDITLTDDINVNGLMTVGETLAVTSSISGGSLAISGSSNFAGDVDFDGAITRDGGTVLFDTNGVLNQASIATGAIASAKLTSVVTGASVGSATAVPVITFNDKGQITSATTTSVAGVSGFAYDSSNKRFRITTQAGTNLDASIAAGSITSTELDTISGLTVQQYGSATEVPVFSVDAKGRITAAAEVAVAGISSVGYTSANNNVRISTGDGKTHDLTIAPATASVKGVASFTNDFTVSTGAVSLADTVVKTLAGDSGTITPSSHSFTIAGTSNEIETSASGSTLTVGLPSDVTIGRDLTVTRDLDVTQNVSIGGNLTVTGTTTTVDSTTVSIADPIFELGEDTSDDNLDRGIIMKYNSSGAKKAFIGFDDSDGKFTMIPDATDTASVITGTVGTLKANLEGDITGNVTGNVTGNITGGSSSFTTVDINGGTIDGTNIGASSAGTGAFTTISASGNITGNLVGNVTGNVTGNITGNVSGSSGSTTGNAATATALATARTIGGASFDGSGNIDVKVKTTSEGSSASEHFLTFVDNTTNDSIEKDMKEDADLTYVPQTGTLTSAIVSAGTNFLGDTLKNTDNRDVITKTGSGVGENQFHGSATSAATLTTGRNITLSGAVTGTIGFDGSQAVTIATEFIGGGTSIGSSAIASDAVTQAKIATGAVTSTELKSSTGTDSDRAVTENHIRDGAVTHAKLGTDSVDETNLDETKTYTMAGLVVDQITVDGRFITSDNNNTLELVSGTGAGIKLDSASDIILDAGNNVMRLQSGGTNFGRIVNSSGNLELHSGTTAMMRGSGANANFLGAITATGDITAFASSSDITLKENIQPIENALDKVSKIRGVTFNYIDKPDERVPGVIAQELQEVLPEAVYKTEDDKLAVRYGNTIALLLEAIKELKKEVEELKGK